MGAAKAIAGTAVPAAMTLVASWVVKQYTGVEIPMDVQAAMAVIIGAVGGLAVYFIPNKEV